MRVTITGAAGYIGSVLTPYLLNRGHEVVALDNFSASGSQTSLLACCTHPKFTMVRGDARDTAVLADALQGADIVIPLAALVGAPACEADPWMACTTNYEAIRILLEARGPEQRIIFPNSNSAYGKTPNGEYATEDSPLNPLSIYARTKLDAEQAILDSGNAVVFRLATVFGVSPRMRCDLLVQDFTLRAITDGFILLYEAGARRNFIGLPDVVRAFDYAITTPLPDGVYNLGLDAANMTKLELAQEIAKFVEGFQVISADVGHDQDGRDYLVSNQKLREAGFEGCYSLHQGISDLLQAFQMVRRTEYSNLG